MGDDTNTLVFTSSRYGTDDQEGKDVWTGQNFSSLYSVYKDRNGQWTDVPTLYDNSGKINTSSNEGDYPYGGGAGMVMAVEPLANCIEELKRQRSYDEIIYTAPDGEMLSQPMANTLSLKENLMILCGHYKRWSDSLFLL